MSVIDRKGELVPARFKVILIMAKYMRSAGERERFMSCVAYDTIQQDRTTTEPITTYTVRYVPRVEDSQGFVPRRTIILLFPSFPIIAILVHLDRSGYLQL